MDRFAGACDPAQMKRIADIVFYRRYADNEDQSKRRPDQWPTRSDFEMYVRRYRIGDLDLGAVPTATSGSGLQAQRSKEIPLTALALHDATYDELPLVEAACGCVGPDGTTVIADSGNHRIVVIGADGRLCFLRQPMPPG